MSCSGDPGVSDPRSSLSVRSCGLQMGWVIGASILFLCCEILLHTPKGLYLHIDLNGLALPALGVSLIEFGRFGAFGT